MINWHEDETEFNKKQISAATPYLDEESYTRKDAHGKYINKLIPIGWRCFAWYYCHNYANASDAYRRMKNIDVAKCDTKQKSVHSSKGHELLRHEAVKNAIELIRKAIKRTIEAELPSNIIETLKVQAFYDRTIFFNSDGSLAFSSWEDVPPKYRCCVEGMEQKPAKDGELITVLKLVCKTAALDKLTKICPDLLQPEKVILISESEEILNGIKNSKSKKHNKQPVNN